MQLEAERSSAPSHQVRDAQLRALSRADLWAAVLCINLSGQ